MSKHRFIASLLLSTSLLSGCATIVGESTQTLPIMSSPSDARILITDEKGMQIFKGLTPTSVVLQKSDGSYWGKKSFTVEISKEGYETQVIPVTASANGWYIAGNLFFGGLIGYFIVDPLNGGMYTLSPEHVNANFGNKLTENNEDLDKSISIVLLEDVPESMRKDMKKIN
ncbi:hypothetical protein [Endozoicomonas ascidiicola]|uniref:hypothetical protein n=1 Tax=Endozoicomonas ascidiicola TaxID=1698521 RepID=UPI0008369220|nr:hypothetical protein [Endozoicomonas ascidiicola]